MGGIDNNLWTWSVNQEGFFVAVLRALEACGTRYMVAGSVAVILYGGPRLTNGMDVVAEADDANSQAASGRMTWPSRRAISMMALD